MDTPKGTGIGALEGSEQGNGPGICHAICISKVNQKVNRSEHGSKAELFPRLVEWKIWMFDL